MPGSLQPSCTCTSGSQPNSGCKLLALFTLEMPVGLPSRWICGAGLSQLKAHPSTSAETSSLSLASPTSSLRN